MNSFLVIIGVAVIFIVVNSLITAGRNRGIAMVDAAAAKKLAEDPQVTLLDVRSPGEFDEGHLRKATLIPVSELGNRLDEITSPKDSPLLVYCRSGHRSSIAAQMLRRQGFTKINNLRGGIMAWQAAGFEVTRK